ncbi:MAG TPA: hypothetical protein PKY59_07940 [Pyrinomonadaceae bacterium]|nr:hypothetical protein [Pyrinomonadaceae bacterium]
MREDKLDLFNVGLKDKIVAFDDDELWQFFLDREEMIKELCDWKNPDRKYKFNTHSILIIAYAQGIDHMRKLFLKYNEYQDDYDAMIYTAVEDFCFAHDYVKMGYFATCGYYDNPASCDVKKADDVMPAVIDEEELTHEKQYFHLLEANHLKGIIDSMEKNFDAMTDNTREDIEKIKSWYEICNSDENFKVAYYFSDF